jgi:hypothetical protein
MGQAASLNPEVKYNTQTDAALSDPGSSASTHPAYGSCSLADPAGLVGDDQRSTPAAATHTGGVLPSCTIHRLAVLALNCEASAQAVEHLKVPDQPVPVSRAKMPLANLRVEPGKEEKGNPFVLPPKSKEVHDFGVCVMFLSCECCRAINICSVGGAHLHTGTGM